MGWAAGQGEGRRLGNGWAARKCLAEARAAVGAWSPPVTPHHRYDVPGATHTPCPPRATLVPGIGQSKSVAHFYSKKIFLLELLVFSAGFNTHCFYFQRSRCHALLFSPHYCLGKCRAKACVNQVSFLNTAPCSLPIKPVSCWVVYTPRLALPRWEIAF